MLKRYLRKLIFEQSGKISVDLSRSRTHRDNIISKSCYNREHLHLILEAISVLDLDLVKEVYIDGESTSSISYCFGVNDRKAMRCTHFEDSEEYELLIEMYDSNYNIDYRVILDIDLETFNRFNKMLRTINNKKKLKEVDYIFNNITTELGINMSLNIEKVLNS